MSNSEYEKTNQKTVGDEIDLVDLFLVMWSRKWIIVIVTLLSVLIGVVVSFSMPKAYEITAILEPGRDSEGGVLENPQAIRENILGGAYNSSIAKQLNLALNDIPGFKVSVPKNTDLVKIGVESSDPELGVEILRTLLLDISIHLSGRLEFKVDKAKNQLEAIKLKIKTLDEKISLLGKQSSKVEKKMYELENGRRSVMTSTKDDAVAVLLYSNELQNSQIYLNNLQMEKANLEGQRLNNELGLENAELKLLSIKGTNINKPPTVPGNPTKPRKAIIIAFSLFLGLAGGIVMAFMAEFLNKVCRKKTSSARSCT